MSILIAASLAIIAAAAVVYPFLRAPGRDEHPPDEGSRQSESARRWDAALLGLKSTELEWAIGNLTEGDHRWLRHQYVAEAAAIMKTMQLDEAEEEELLATVRREVMEARTGPSTAERATHREPCPECPSSVEQGRTLCAGCGRPNTGAGPKAAPGTPR